MMPLPENDFAEAHELFNQGHAEQRARLMAALSQATQPRPKKASWRTIPLPLRLTAAGLLIAATAAFLSLSQGERAYGIEGLRERLLTIRSLHVKGWIYQQTKTEVGKATIAFPTEMFYERPYRNFRTYYGFSFGEAEKLTQVTSSAIVDDGEKTMVIDNDKKTARLAPADKLSSELRIEQFLQQSLFEQIGKGNLGEFKQVGTEQIDKAMCDVYEHLDQRHEPMRFRQRIWLNPQDGLPVKFATYEIEPTGEEVIFFEWTEIGINVEPPPEMFSFQVPEGYERIEANNPTPRGAALTTSSAGSSTQWTNSGVGLNIDGSAVLFCWSLKTTDKNGPQWFQTPPEFSLKGVGKRPCEEITLRTDDNGEQRWRWSLIVPRDRQPLGGSSLSMICRHAGNTTIGGATPLEFGHERLAEIVEAVQRRTLPENHDSAELWTLEELRQKLGEVR